MKDGSDAPADSDVAIETMHENGTDRQIIFRGCYADFSRVADQHAPDAAIAAQRRAVANDRYFIRLTVTLPPNSSSPAPAADGSWFELECFKHLVNVTA